METEALKGLLHRVDLRDRDTHIILDREQAFPGQHPELVISDLRRRLHDEEQAVVDGAGAHLRIALGHRLQFRGGRAFIRNAELRSHGEVSMSLIRALRRSHADLMKLNASPFTSPRELLTAEVPETQHDRQVARLALMSPELQRRIADGRQPPELTVRGLLKSPMPLAWADQADWLEKLANYVN